MRFIFFIGISALFFCNSCKQKNTSDYCQLFHTNQSEFENLAQKILHFKSAGYFIGKTEVIDGQSIKNRKIYLQIKQEFDNMELKRIRVHPNDITFHLKETWYKGEYYLIRYNSAIKNNFKSDEYEIRSCSNNWSAIYEAW